MPQGTAHGDRAAADQSKLLHSIMTSLFKMSPGNSLIGVYFCYYLFKTNAIFFLVIPVFGEQAV